MFEKDHFEGNLKFLDGLSGRRKPQFSPDFGLVVAGRELDKFR